MSFVARIEFCLDGDDIIVTCVKVISKDNSYQSEQQYEDMLMESFPTDAKELIVDLDASFMHSMYAEVEVEHFNCGTWEYDEWDYNLHYFNWKISDMYEIPSEEEVGIENILGDW